jgi:hypothetical protein
VAAGRRSARRPMDTRDLRCGRSVPAFRYH